MEQKEINIILTAIYNILFTNDIVCSLIIDTIEVLRKHGLYRQKVKQICREIELNQHKYEKMINRIVGIRSSFIADANQFITDELQVDLTKMEYSIKLEFDKAEIKNSAALAKVELMRCLTEYACLSLDRRIEECHHYNQDIKHIDYLRMTRIYQLADKLSDVLYRQQSGNKYVNLNQSMNCNNGMCIIIKKLTNSKLIQKAIEEGDRLNPVK